MDGRILGTSVLPSVLAIGAAITSGSAAQLSPAIQAKLDQILKVHPALAPSARPETEL